MSASSNHNEHGTSNKGYEEDVSAAGMGTLAAYVVVLSTFFFVSLGGLYMYFKWESARELQRKVANYEDPALKKLRADEAEKLKGVDKAINDVAGAIKSNAAPATDPTPETAVKPEEKAEKAEEKTAPSEANDTAEKKDGKKEDKKDK